MVAPPLPAYAAECWSTIQKVAHVNLGDPPKSIFSEHYISAPRGAGPTNFCTR